ncbi:hypothetical protein [Serratia liquefaciens]|uniref:hypothetical protein n=1 Tax=Serratia liquefaciens TaxID=614 RepID=UPI003EC851CC
MRLTALSYYKSDKLQWITSEVGMPPLDVSGVEYLLHSMSSFDRRHQLESTRRTLEAIVRDGLLEKITSYEHRQDTAQSGSGRGVWCNVSRYALPGSCTVLRDDGGKRDAIDGETVRID